MKPYMFISASLMLIPEIEKTETENKQTNTNRPTYTEPDRQTQIDTQANTDRHTYRQTHKEIA